MRSMATLPPIRRGGPPSSEMLLRPIHLSFDTYPAFRQIGHGDCGIRNRAPGRFEQSKPPQREVQRAAEFQASEGANGLSSSEVAKLAPATSRAGKAREPRRAYWV